MTAAGTLRAFADHLDTLAAAHPWDSRDKNVIRADTLAEIAREARRWAERGERASDPSPDTLGDPEGAEEALVARDRARLGAELHGGAGWTRQSGQEEGT